MERFFEITERGRKQGGNVSPNNRNEILDKLRFMKSSVSLEQLSTMTGKDKYTLLSELRRLASSDLVREVGNGHFQ